MLTPSLPTAICLPNIAVGMLLAELHTELGATATSTLPSRLPFLMIFTGLFLCSYPQDAPERMPWSHTMQTLITPLIPTKADPRRYWDSLGASTLILGIFFSRNGRRLLSSPVFNFLGRVSFPVYLLHNQLIKSVLTWMVYINSYLNPPRDDDGKELDLVTCGRLQFVLAVVLFYIILYRSALFWVQRIDPVCGAAVNWLLARAYPTGPPTERPILIS